MDPAPVRGVPPRERGRVTSWSTTMRAGDTLGLFGDGATVDRLIDLVGAIGLRWRTLEHAEDGFDGRVAAVVLAAPTPRDLALDRVRTLAARTHTPFALALTSSAGTDPGLPHFTAPFKAVDLAALLRPYLPDRIPAPAAILRARAALSAFVGTSPALREVVRRLPRVARSGASVLVAGETGTGKELCARALHYLGPRADQPFVALNCGAIPPGVADNELFGHVEGAYTGAGEASPGLLRTAHQGTLFLDEVDSLPATVQAKLLRFLQEGEVRPLGSADVDRADVRVVAATNACGERPRALREDLFFRLSTIRMRLPPLRDRLGDVPDLARHFLERFSALEDRPGCRLSEACLDALLSYGWPGNVRELQHVIRRAVVLSDEVEIPPAALELPVPDDPPVQESFKEAKQRAVATFERRFIERMLRRTDGNISRAATLSKKDRRAFWELIRKHHIDVDQFRA